MTTTLPAHNLSERDVRLLVHIAAESQTRTIAGDPALGLERAEIDTAVGALLKATGSRTMLQLVAWGAAHGLVTDTAEPCAALAAPRLPPRLRQILTGWVGGRSTPELTADFGISPATMRGYIKDLNTRLGVHSQMQASIAGVLSGQVLLSSIDPSWPAEPFHRTAGSRGRAA
ncbi:LuxR C-terminal-related transcriptional regulator [Kitasatospora aureofaciens]|uniref:helix-turn-helix transcriptional regulator n=1 Tax=Kitasatospora aureofaciens TaxID=1894 RepID=UPI001C44E24B|nr:LuxR C-terminal-related transcriptional regulator [Kitasatospora aureofaciens]MBV6695677.1 LuxR C-terminal-related transcriptional regulator [Kitasatospora aureofaciens]